MKRIITMLAVVSIAVGVSLSLCGCREEVKLEGTEWQLSKIYDRAESPVNDEYTISFAESNLEDGSRVSALGKCNRLFGNYTYSASGELKMEKMGMTRMLCPQPEFEDEFAKMLNEVTNFKVKDNTLILMSNGEVVAEMLPFDAQ